MRKRDGKGRGEIEGGKEEGSENKEIRAERIKKGGGSRTEEEKRGGRGREGGKGAEKGKERKGKEGKAQKREKRERGKRI